MANQEHIEILKQGVKAWNKWREDNPDIRLDLIRANLSNADLSGANLSNADLSNAALGGADLHGAMLYGAILVEADLSEANLDGANLVRAHLRRAHLVRANLHRANLSGANLNEASLVDVVLRDANLQHAKMKNVKGLRAGQLGGANISCTTLPPEIESFDAPLVHVTEASKNARNMFVMIILVCVYSLLTIGTTRDVHLITNSTSTPLPIVKALIPVVHFYCVGPVFLLGLYVYLHIYLLRLWESLANLPAIFPDGRRLCDKVYPWMLTGLIQRYFPRLKDDPKHFAWTQDILSIFLAWWAVPLTAVAFWFRYLYKHDMRVTGFHVVILTALIWLGFKFFFTTKSILQGESKSKLTGLLKWLCWFKQFGTIFLIGVVLLIVSADMIGKLGPWRWDSRFVSVNADITDADVSTKPLNWTGINPNDIALIKGARLEGKDLRNMRAEGAFLTKANLSNADLNNANLGGADLREAKLVGADLNGAQLHGANLNNANLSGAKLKQAYLRWADFSEADLCGADLSETDLRAANLSTANLRKANLSKAYLFVADLNNADLRNADLSGAFLRGADLREVNLDSIVNWKKIEDLKDANIYGVRNAPDGFVEWAIETMGAVSFESTYEWKKHIEEAGKVSSVNTIEKEDKEVEQE